MKRQITAATLLLASAHAPAAQQGWLTLGERAYQDLRLAGQRFNLLANRPIQAGDTGATENLYLLQLPLRDLDRVSVALHRRQRHCGGFMFHANEADARAALGVAVPATGTRPTYQVVNHALVSPLLAAMDEQQLAATISQLEGFVNRYYTSTHGTKASDWLLAHWRAIGAQHPGISVAQFQHAGYPQRSVIATLAGSDLADQVLVLGGHLDSISLGISRADASAPGADDDASGIAGLTEVLHVLAASNYRPRRTIKLIGYAAEEVGLRGSQDIARDFRNNGVDVAGVLQLDMTNYKGSAKDIYLIDDYTDSAQNVFLEKLVAAYLPGISVGRDRCGYACSDHASWHAQGYAVSMPFEAAMGQDNPHIHTKRDTYANSGKQAAHALKFARLAAAWAVELGTGSPQHGAMPGEHKSSLNH